MKVGDLAPAPYNPRTISDWSLEALGQSMGAYGDLSGLVYNRRTGHLIGGHQRIKHIDPEAEIAVVEQLDEPNEVGTVARGFVAVGSELWTYREVDVDEQTEAMMNLAANKHGGEWSFPELPNLVSELDAGGMDLSLAGFPSDELENLLGTVDWDDALDGLPAGDGSGFQQMTFTLTDEQVAVVHDAIQRAIEQGEFQSGNENKNGNALARIAEAYGS